MPTITISKKDLEKLSEKKFSENEIDKALEYCKAEVESIDNDIITVQLGDTNRPDLWSVEGIARQLRTIFGKEKGFKKISTEKSKVQRLIVDKSIKDIRPHIRAFRVKGDGITEDFLKQLIQLQEKISENFGRKRKKVSIGMYKAENIRFPLHYKAVNPDKFAFMPLGFSKKLSLREIVSQHPKGIEYGSILSKNNSRYPLLEDDDGKILSLPPIINSSDVGKVDVGDKDIIVEMTGSDEDSLNLVSAILAYALSDRGYSIIEITVEDGDKIVSSPVLKCQNITLNVSYVNNVLGTSFTKTECVELLKKAGYNFNSHIIIPPYRDDIMHQADIVEDIAIAYGYHNLKFEEIKVATTATIDSDEEFVNGLRDLLIGFGMQEVYSQILSNKEVLYDKMLLSNKYNECAKILNVTSNNYSVVRSWIMPVLLEMLTSNRHVEYPHKIFEEGYVTIKKASEFVDERHLAFLIAKSDATPTELKQIVEYIGLCLKVDITIKSSERPFFINGRCASIFVEGVEVGFFGAIHPQVLNNMNLAMPVVGCEINISKLMENLKQKYKRRS